MTKQRILDVFKDIDEYYGQQTESGGKRMIDTRDIERCVNTEFCACVNCPHSDKAACKTFLLTDALTMLNKEKDFRRVMFNRCATATMRVMDKNACGMCIFREDCEKERTVNPW